MNWAITVFQKKTDKGLVKFIATPSSYVSLDKRTGLSEPYVPMSMNYMAIESDGKDVKEQYTLNFTLISSYDEYNISDGGRLLLKYKDGETLTLATNKAFNCEYSNGNYFVSPEYVITKDQIDSILNKGVVKLRFEIQLTNIDVEPLSLINFMIHFRDKVNGIEKRTQEEKTRYIFIRFLICSYFCYFI